MFQKWKKAPPVDLSKPVSFWGVVRILSSKKTFVLLALGCGLHTFSNYGVGNFFAPFLARVHGMEIAEIGKWMGITSGIGGMIGTFMGGFLADKLGRQDIRWYLWVAVWAEIIAMLPAIGAYYSDNVTLVLVCYFFTSLITAIYLGPCIAVTHNLVDARMRSLASAVLFFILNLIGLGLGPISIGALSDYFAPTYGATSLRWAFTFTFLTGFIAMTLFYLSAKCYPRERRGW